MFEKSKVCILLPFILLTLLLTSCESLEVIFDNPTLIMEWAKCYGGSSGDLLQDVIVTTDDCYVVVGQSLSDDGDLNKNNGLHDLWIAKLNQNGTLLWSKDYGGSDIDKGVSVVETDDGGYVVVGSTNSSDLDVDFNYGGYDVWVIRLDSNGDMIWEQTYGGSDDENSHEICKTRDGGYVIAGQTGSGDGNVIGYHGNYDFWVIKVDDTGNLIWQNALGGTNFDRAGSVQLTNDNGFILAGMTYSNDGDVTTNNGEADVWLLKLDDAGNKLWERNFGGTQSDIAYSVRQTTDNGFIIAGETFSNDEDVSGNHGSTDGWVVRTDSNGDLKWQRCFGGSKYDNIKSIIQTQNGGYACLAYTRSTDGDIPDNKGVYDYLFLVLNENGQIEWNRTFGGSSSEFSSSVVEYTEDAFILGGYTESDDKDVSGNNGMSDFWVVKLSIQ